MENELLSNRSYITTHLWWAFSSLFFVLFLASDGGSSAGKESACNAGDLGSIPGLGSSPGGGRGSLLQYSCPENPMDGGAWLGCSSSFSGLQRVGLDCATLAQHTCDGRCPPSFFCFSRRQAQNSSSVLTVHTSQAFIPGAPRSFRMWYMLVF